jgi:hypothetical protein
MIKIQPDDWSNFAYLLGGFYLLMEFAPVPGIALILLAIGSYLAHVHGGKWWIADWAAMYLTFSAVTIHNLELSWLWLIPVAGVAYKWGTENYVLFATFFLASVISAHVAGLAIIPSLLLFGAGFACQRYAEAAQDHNSKRYQLLHPTWHILTMIAIVLLVS